MTGTEGVFSIGRAAGPGRSSFTGAWLTPILLALGCLYAGYWPTLRTFAPQLAVDAAFFRAIEPDSPEPFEAASDWIVDVDTPVHSNGRVIGTRCYRVNVDSADPWGGTWNFNDVTGAGAESGWRARGIPVRVDLAISLRLAPIALGQELSLVVAGLACAVFLATRPSRGRIREVANTLAGLLLVVAPTTPLVEFVRVRPWLNLAGETLSAWRVHGTIAIAALIALCAVRLQARSVESVA